MAEQDKLDVLEHPLRFANLFIEAQTRGGVDDVMSASNRTALGVGLCCCPEDLVTKVELLLSFGTQTNAVEFQDGQIRSALELARERRIHGSMA